MTVVESKWTNRKSVVGSNQQELAKRVKDHERRGWRKVVKVLRFMESINRSISR